MKEFVITYHFLHKQIINIYGYIVCSIIHNANIQLNFRFTKQEIVLFLYLGGILHI